MKKSMDTKFLVAMNKDKQFFGLNESFATTDPFNCNHPYNAKKIFPFIVNGKPLNEDFWTNIHPATYYFENSERMRRWLRGYKMVIVVMRCEAKVLND